MTTSFKPGDQVLWLDGLSTTFRIISEKDLPSGRILVAEFAQVPDGAAPFKLEAHESKFVARPDGWADAPERPACCGGRFDGCAQNEAEIGAWFAAMMQWERDHKQPLLARLWAEMTVPTLPQAA